MTTKQPRTDQKILSISTVPSHSGDEEGDYYYYAVGYDTWFPTPDKKVKVTEITYIEDIPGLHCSLGRYIIWADEVMVAFINATAVESIRFFPPEN